MARALVDGVQRWAPFISCGFDGWMLSTLTAGMAPAGDAGTALLQVATLGLWRLVGLIYTQFFYATILRSDRPVTAQPAEPSGGNSGTGGTSAAAAVVKPVSGRAAARRSPSAGKKKGSSPLLDG